MKTIFTVTTVMPGHHTRCCAWYKTFPEAEDAVHGNYGDIYEFGHWMFCVIEEIRGGCVYPVPVEGEWWYRWNKQAGGCYRRCNKPDCYKNYMNFGIG